MNSVVRRLKASLVGSGVAALVIGAGAVAVTTDAFANQPMAATTWVNLRSGPSTSEPVITVLAPGQEVEATGTVANGWYEVATDDAEGWVYKTYLTSTLARASAEPTPQAAATGTATTTTSVNVRSGPATSYSVVTTVPRGTEVPTTGTTEGSWTQVIHAGQARWIHGAYLTTATPIPAETTPTAPTPTQPAPEQSAAPSPSTQPDAGAADTSSPGTPPAPTAPAPPPVVGQVQTTANLYLRTGGTISSPADGVLPAKTVVGVTGNRTASYTEIVHAGVLRWIATSYTAPVAAAAPAAPAAPTASGTMYVNVGILNVRATSSPTGTVVGSVTRGTALPVTGAVEGDRTQVLYQGAARWVYTPYIAATPPAEQPTAPPATSSTAGTTQATQLSSTLVIPAGITTSGITQLNANARKVVAKVVADYPKIRTIYGWRASSDYSSDHPNGRAVDIMIPNWTSADMADYGWQIAHHFQDNASDYKVTYIIYRQSIWNAAYPDRGWRAMEDRGSSTANHYDHVHVSVSP